MAQGVLSYFHLYHTWGVGHDREEIFLPREGEKQVQTNEVARSLEVRSQHLDTPLRPVSLLTYG